MTSPFELLPAIDLREGRVVRLRQGNFDQETAFSDDPVAVAVGFAAGGAAWLHVVDLDGARSGTPVHMSIIGAIAAAVGGEVLVEAAGGLRTADAVRAVLGSGAARAVVGTAALRDPSFAGALVEEHGPDRVAVAIDVRDGRRRRQRLGRPSPRARCAGRHRPACRPGRRPPSRSPQSTATVCWKARTSALLATCHRAQPGSHHRLGRHRVGPGHRRGPRHRLRGRHHRPRALRGSALDLRDASSAAERGLTPRPLSLARRRRRPPRTCPRSVAVVSSSFGAPR